MRTFPLLLALACAGTALLVPLAVHAQASLDQRALAPLQPPQTKPEATKPEATKPATAKPPTRPARRPTPPHNGAQHPAAPAAQPAPAAPPPAPPQVRVPLAPPPPPVLPPALVVPTRPPAPPSPVPIADDAPGITEAIQDGLRVTFGDGRADLNPATDSALRTFIRAAPATASFTVAAFAPGSPEDASTPRRLSLSRALAIRSALIAEGIASVRIYVKALGGSREVADGPANRVDVTVGATNPQARSPQ